MGALGKKATAIWMNENSLRSPNFQDCCGLLKANKLLQRSLYSCHSTIPAILHSKFGDIALKESEVFKCQLERALVQYQSMTHSELLLNLTVDNNRAFSSPPTPELPFLELSINWGIPGKRGKCPLSPMNDMFQRGGHSTFINLCLTGKTSGFERPRAPVSSHIQLAKGNNRGSVFGMTIPMNSSMMSSRGAVYSDVSMKKLQASTGFLLLKPSLEDLRGAQFCKRGPGKGKEKVMGEEQAAKLLLNLQTPKKKRIGQQNDLQAGFREVGNQAGARMNQDPVPRDGRTRQDQYPDAT
ncbi:hypothetical protein Tco_0637974 [Tanacetum coccineum]